MKSKHSLVKQFRTIFIASTSLIVICFAIFSSWQFVSGIFEAMQMSLLLEGEEFDYSYRTEGTSLPPNRRYLKSYIGWENVPVRIQELFPRSKHKNRRMENGNVFSEDKPFIFFMPFNIINTNKTLFMVREFDPDDHIPDTDIDDDDVALAILFFASIIVIILLAKVTSNQLLKPIRALDKMTQEFEMNQLNNELPKEIADNEIGAIAKKLQHAMNTRQSYHQRELDFLRNASHELRTPIAVTRSALDIIDRKMDLNVVDIKNLIQQIRHANTDMSSLTNCLLQLARDGEKESEVEVIDFAQTIKKSVSDHLYLLEGTHKQAKINTREQSLLLLNPTLVNISIANLIRNAFEHSGPGDINITVFNHKIIVSNYSSDALLISEQTKQRLLDNEDNSNLGLGLRLVLRIANQQNWTLSFDYSEGKTVEVCLDFGADKLFQVNQ